MTRRALIAAALAASLALPAAADRLLLTNGRSIDADAWWYDEDWLRYETPAGTFGIPRGLVADIVEGRATKRREAPRPAPVRLPTIEEHERADAGEALGEAMQALQRRDYEVASARYLEVLRTHPEAHAARTGYVVSEIALGHDGAALSSLLEGLMRAPEHADFHELLGELRYREERVEDALASWRKAFATTPSDRVRDKIVKAERELQTSRHYDFSATPHFNVRYDGMVDVALARDVMDYLEQKYWELTGEYSHSPKQPITVLLYPSREFREVTQSPDWVGGLYDGKIRVPLGGLRRLDPRAERVLTHELTHAVVHSKTRGSCPRWLHEGLAQRAEGKRIRLEDERRLAREANVDPEDWAAFYPTALAVTLHLESRRGFSGLNRVLELLGQGRNEEDALIQLYGESFEKIFDRWARSVAEDES
ncbi:MAG: hypothetical protein GY716_13845 [bacterium]|nr:hypothetical protein [bacterium]